MLVRHGQAAGGRTRTTPRASPATTRPAARRRWQNSQRPVGLHPRRHWSRLGYLTPGRGGERWSYPDTVKPYDPNAGQSGLDRPTGLVVNHVLSELRQTDRFRGKPDWSYIRERRLPDRHHHRQAGPGRGRGGGRHPPRRPRRQAVRGQPTNWQAALVAVEPGTGRVLAYYGGNDGTGRRLRRLVLRRGRARRRGFGQHPPGSSFKVYDLAEALQAEHLRWSRTGTRRRPRSSRPRAGPRAARPARSATPARPPASPTARSCAGHRRLAQRAVLRPDRAAGHRPTCSTWRRKAGIDSMWANVPGNPRPVRVDLRGKPASRASAERSPPRSASASTASRCWTTPTAWPRSPPAASGPRPTSSGRSTQGRRPGLRREADPDRHRADQEPDQRARRDAAAR